MIVSVGKQTIDDVIRNQNISVDGAISLLKDNTIALIASKLTGDDIRFWDGKNFKYPDMTEERIKRSVQFNFLYDIGQAFAINVEEKNKVYTITIVKVEDWNIVSDKVNKKLKEVQESKNEYAETLALRRGNFDLIKSMYDLIKGKNATITVDATGK